MNIPLSRNSSYPKKLKLRVHNSIFLVCIFPSVRQIFHLGSAPFGLVCLPQTADCHGWLVSGSLVRPLCSHHHQLSNQFWSGVIPVNGGCQIYPSSNLFNSHSPSRSILQTNALALLLHLRLPRLLWSSWLPLAPHFKLQCFSQNVPIIPPQHKSSLLNTIRLISVWLSFTTLGSALSLYLIHVWVPNGTRRFYCLTTDNFIHQWGSPWEGKG